MLRVYMYKVLVGLNCELAICSSEEVSVYVYVDCYKIILAVISSYVFFSIFKFSGSNIPVFIDGEVFVNTQVSFTILL